MNRFYSRFANIEEKRNLRSAILFIILTIVLISLIFFIGIPLLGKFTAFVSDLKNGSKQISKNDTTPPASPKFNYFPDFVNQQTASVSGNTEPGATIRLTFNGKNQEVLADKNGTFSFNLQLQSGISTFSAIAIDQSGNQSQKTQDYQITLDNKPPDLSISSPTDGSSFFGSNQRQVTIQGKTESDCQVTINDRIILVDDNGSFQYTTTLNAGINPFTIKSTDQANNTTEKDLNLNFTP